MHDRVGDSICRVGESAWLAGVTTISRQRRTSVQTILAPEALLLWSRERRLIGEGKGPELLRLLMNEDDFAVVCRPNDLKRHRDLFCGGNFRHRVKGSHTSLDDQKTGHAAEKLIGRRSVLVHVVPVGTGRMIFGKVNFYIVRRTGFHLTKDVVGDAQRRNHKAMGGTVELVFVVWKPPASNAGRVGGKLVDDKYRQLVS